jgi:hypothetical protein
VDTALFKSYLVTQPALLGALCRLANWCEVSEVEEELRAREVRRTRARTQSKHLLTLSEICGANISL